MEEGEDLFADVGVVDIDREERVRDVDVLGDAIVAKAFRLRVLVQDVVRQVADDLERVDDDRLRCRKKTISKYVSVARLRDY